MKRRLLLVLLCLFIVSLSLNVTACGTTHCSLKSGMYGFEFAVIKNKFTQEITKKSIDDILNNETQRREWGNLFSFRIFVDDKTEYIKRKDNRYIIIDEGIDFEVAEENTLRLHFPNWQGYDYQTFDIVIVLGWQITYGK